MELTSKKLLAVVRSRGAIYESELQSIFANTEDISFNSNILRETTKLMRLKLIDVDFDGDGNRIYTNVIRTLN